MADLTETQAQIVDVCDSVKALLLRKNAAYGDSALSPLRVFSKANVDEQIAVRMDDKLSRLSRGHELEDETFDETLRDLIGYAVLMIIARRREQTRRVEPVLNTYCPEHDFDSGFCSSDCPSRKPVASLADVFPERSDAVVEKRVEQCESDEAK